MAARFDVALGNPGESDYNTLVLSGVDITVPLEMDLDDDPLQDDEIRLRSVDGFFQKILKASDADVTPTPGSRLLMYRFRDVPPGAYRISVRVAGTWSDVLTGLVVTRDGVFHGKKKLGTEPEQVKLGPAPEEAPPPEEAEEEEVLSEYLDLNPGFQDREG